MREPSASVLIVTEDGATDVPGAVPVVHGLVDAIERLFNSLGIPTRETPPPPAEPD